MAKNISIKTNDEWQDYYGEHKSLEYPVGVYYINTQRMFMHNIRLNYHDEIEIDFINKSRISVTLGLFLLYPLRIFKMKFK